MTEESVFPSTSVDYFTTWFVDFVGDMFQGRSFPVEDGMFVVYYAYRVGPIPSGAIRLAMKGAYGYKAEAEQALEIEIKEVTIERVKFYKAVGDTRLLRTHLWQRQGDVFTFDLLPLDDNQLEVRARCYRDALEIPFEEVLAEIEKRWPGARKELTGEQAEAQADKKRGGRPGLDHDELIYRLAKAQEAEEMRLDNPDMTWKEIAKEIKWRHGISKAGIKLLEDARLSRLRRLKKSDPDHLLEQVKAYREGKEKIKT
jgi:hypothetical protein